MHIDVLFQNSHLLIINKPAGMLVHGDGKSAKPTVVEWVLLNFPEIAGVGEQMMVDGKTIDRPGIVHRLDEETSGALVVAKTHDAFLYLKQQFKDRHIEKEYHAFVRGHFKEPVVLVDEPIGRSSGDFRKWQAGRGIRGEVREAHTLLKAVAQFEDAGERFSFIHAFPKTGRTHQIRVHCKFLQRPIVCDRLYGDSYGPALGFVRLALHARSIRFRGVEGEEIHVTAPYPSDFEAALAKYAKS